MENKTKIVNIYSELAQGNGKPFIDNMDEGVVWTIKGSTKWSKSYKGLEEIRNKLLDPLFSNFKTPYKSRLKRMIVEGRYAVVECEGEVLTHSGQLYNNNYCYVFKLDDKGKFLEITEYGDTALIDKVL